MAFLLVITTLSALAEQSLLLNACNSIKESDKRLNCLNQLFEIKKNSIQNEGSYQPENQNPEIIALKKSFNDTQAIVNQGVSLKDYSRQLLEIAKAFQAYRTSKNPNQAAINGFRNALEAYKDAEALWESYIRNSRDGGIAFGKIFDYEMLGFSAIVMKYNIPTTTVIFRRSILLQPALIAIWEQAEVNYKKAVEISEKSN